MTTPLTVQEQELPALRLVQLTSRMPGMDDVGTVISPLFRQVNAAVEAAGAQHIGPILAHYTLDAEGATAAAAAQIAGEAVPEGLEAHTLEAVPRALVTTYESPDLGGIEAAWDELVSQAHQRGLQPTGTIREVYLRLPYENPDHPTWSICLQQPVA